MFGAFVAGGLVGAAMGMLFAPRKGSETRDMIHDKVKDLEAELDKMGANLLHLKNGSLTETLRAKIKDLEKQVEKLTKKATS